MRELRSAIIADRRVRLVVQAGDYHAVMIEVHGPRGWEDISVRADQDLVFDVDSRRYQQRVAEQEARARAWEKANAPRLLQRRCGGWVRVRRRAAPPWLYLRWSVIVRAGGWGAYRRR
jgi:hypothetical protein